MAISNKSRTRQPKSAVAARRKGGGAPRAEPVAPFRDPWAESKGRQALLSKIFDSLYATFGPQHWWPAGGSQLFDSGGRSGKEEAGSSHAPRAPALAPAKPDARFLPGAAMGSGGIGGATAPHGPPDSNAVFEIVVGAILTQNTAWTNVEKAIENLRSAGCLTPESLRGVSTERLAHLLRPSGYFNLKAERLKSFINFLYQQYSGDLRRMLGEEPHLLRQKLLRVKGIGPETADSILLYAGSFPWFVVDAYTRRILSRHGLVADEVSYQGLQDFFMNNLPRDTKLYNEYHALMVRLGKDVCRREPLCKQCPLLEVLGEPIHK